MSYPPALTVEMILRFEVITCSPRRGVSTDLHFFGGTETITDPIEVIVVPGFLAGFEDLNTHGLVSTQDGPDLATYDLSGPVTAQGYPYLSTGATFLTTGGELTFSTYSSLSSTFSAVPRSPDR